MALVVENGLGRPGRIGDAQRPVPQARDGYRPAVAVAELQLGVLELGADAVVVGERDAAVVALEPDRADAERPADDRLEAPPVPRITQLAVETVLARADRDAAPELPGLQLAKHAAARFPVSDVGQQRALRTRAAGENEHEKQTETPTHHAAVIRDPV